ncbi:transcriptional regulator Myc-2 [Coccinella septempunctata]|uniref:transcriptional regulator Myc-2 n=1 Tax=Coccinella septempunctata TaxID=41139 RepID=UPI001D05F4B1|nr:transcriptional regulator Myc-2 [Coccinella septempunctata]
MQLPYKYDDLLNDDFGLETNSTTLREVNKKDKLREKDTDTTSIDSIDTMVEWTCSEYLADDLWNSLTSDSASGMFSRTFFDDIALELGLDNTYDSLFAETIPYHCDRWSGPPINKDVLIKSHDCMWAGHCASSEHKDDYDKALHKFWAGFLNTPKAPAPAAPAAAAVPIPTSQQSLLKPNLRNAGVPVINMITPHTPPMSDTDDESKKKRAEGASSDIDEADQELREYFGSSLVALDGPHQEVEESSESSSESESSESEDEPYQQAGPSRVAPNVTSLQRNMYATQNDHSYHKDKNSSMIMSDLGIDTPSDSGGSTPPRCDSVKSLEEEEIDVVSVPDKKYPVGTRMGYIPPTNPPNGGRRNMQRPSEPAMTQGRNNRNGVKVMLPTKRTIPATDYPPAKRRATAAAAPAPATENKGRRPRQTRTTNQSRRRSNNSHDSEGSENDQHHPIEKRNLHNDMERQRRVDLRKAFEDLRKLVPEVMRKERAAKVVILREAAKYCNNLTQTSKSMEQHMVDLENYQEKLIWKLSYLRRKAAKENGFLCNQDYDD